MAFNVNFYNFAKRENATYRPTGSGTEYSCILKEASSIANPTIQLDIGTNDSPSYNYCYIGEFDRYYWITDWTWIKNRLWEATLSTDLLATFKDEIGAASLYVLRSAAAYDGTINDEFYPAKVNSTFQTLEQATPFTFNVQSGAYVVGIASGLHPTYGTTTYWLLDTAQLDALMQSLNSEIVQAPNFTTADASFALQKALIDPFQFITSCIWFPLDYSDIPALGGQTNISAGGFPLNNATGEHINASTPLKEYTLSFALPNHPQIARGNYMNGNYRKLFLEIPPFGTCELDGLIAANYSNIIVKISIDAISGMGTIRVGCGNNTDIDVLLERYETQVGVPMQLSNIRTNIMGGAANLASSLIGGIASLAMGNIAGGGINGVSGITGTLDMFKPRVNYLGSTGSFASLTNTKPQSIPTSYVVQAKLYVQFINIVDEDLDHSGRPLCQIRQISTLSGYNVVKDGEVDINGFTGEAEAVRAYLESGFFYG